MCFPTERELPLTIATLWSAASERSGDGALVGLLKSSGPIVSHKSKAVSRYACHRTPNKDSRRNRMVHATVACYAILLFALSTSAQSNGRLTGVVTTQTNTPAAEAFVVAQNQVTSRESRTKSGTDGRYALQLKPGAYRVFVRGPFAAAFDKNKSYGDFAIVRGDVLENVIITAGKDTTLDILVTARESLNQTRTEAAPDSQKSSGDRRETRDRWRLEFPEYDRYGDRGARGRDIPFRKGRWYDPYNQSVLKGDYPIIGNKTFMVLSATSFSSLELRRAPTPSDVSSVDPLSAEFFGQPEALAASETLQFSFELFHGDTTFKPRDWAIKISPTFSVPNYLNARENGVVNIDVRRGTTRTDTQVSLEEAFGEVKLADLGANYDFVSLRAGIQPFVSDFRGFIYSDNNLGARVFGSLANNRYQYNLAFFSQLEKDTNSGLNRFDLRHQDVYIANVYRQDFIRKGYTIQASLHFNDDRRSRKYDRNGFLVRPALIGDIRPHAIKVGYLGISGDGHLGRLNLTHSFYHVLGTDDRNPIAGRSVRVRSNMAAIEASVDRDYLRFRGSMFWAEGDANPTDGTATGFDAIFDDPNFAGGQFSFWNRQGIRLTQTGVGLVQPNSLLPSLRSSKIEGQANFVNPGIFIYNAGVDVEVTQRLKAVLNVNYLRFHRTQSLEYVLFQNNIRHDIGFDYSLGIAYRPFLINNVTLTFGAATLQTGRGFRDIYTDRSRNCPANVSDFCEPEVISPRKPLYSLFTQLKLVF
jgi:Carboxypeptidase regulatory-like domain